jgi:nondiscriminating aspartyl-tRNA synthetase
MDAVMLSRLGRDRSGLVFFHLSQRPPRGVTVERTWSDGLARRIGDRVRIVGWLHRLRELSAVSFAIVRDGRGLAQVVLRTPEEIASVRGVVHESVVQITGTATASAQAPGGVEVVDATIEVLSAAQQPPIELFRPDLTAQLPTLLDLAPVTLRHPKRRAVFRLAAASTAGFRRALSQRGYTEINTPKILAAATEGGAHVFKVDYFGRSAFLAQSPQLYKQIMVGVFERVFEVGPVFRAEPHDTARHLNEYVSLDAEIGFIDDHRTVMHECAATLAGMLELIQEDCAEQLELLGVALPSLPAEIPQIHFEEALGIVAAVDSTEPPTDLTAQHERILGEWARHEFGSDFLFVVGYPLAGRPFYTHPDPERPKYSRGFDLLFRGMELVTGSQRLHLIDDYLVAMEERGVPREDLEFYLMAFRHGMPPHGGFAIGLERWVAQLVGLQSVKEATLFPRDINRLSP